MANFEGDSSDEKQKKKKIKRRVSFGSAVKFNYDHPDRLKELEKDFVLDGVCLSHLANDETDRTFPSLNIGIPQYHAQFDKSTSTYFKRKGLPKFVTATANKDKQQSSMQGQQIDRFCASSKAIQYLTAKKKEGAGTTRQVWGGHTSAPTDPAMIGWNSEEGYRRNTFDLRARKSVFDYEDPFDNPKQLQRPRQRTQSAPATMRLMRLKSASVYRSHPGGRPMTAMPQIKTGPNITTRPLATGPLT